MSNLETQSAVHEEMFRTLLQTPHRQVDQILHLHKEQFNRDPNFYAKLAIYAIIGKNCAVRDVNDVFLTVLFDSPYLEHRDAAYIMLQYLPVIQISRIAKYFTGYSEIVKHHPLSDKPLPSAQFGVTIKRAKYGQNHHDPALRGKEIPRLTFKMSAKKIRYSKQKDQAKEIQLDTWEIYHAGLGRKSIKGTLKKAIIRYLHDAEIDGNIEWSLLRSKKKVKELYCRCRTSPRLDWVKNFLFNNKITDENSRLFGLKKLSQTEDPADQAALIVKYKIPYTQAISVIKNMTPSVLIALIDVMSPQELLQSLGSLQKRGAYDNQDVKKFVEDKLNKAKSGSKFRLDALKGAKAATVEGLDEDIKQLAIDITDSQLKKHGQITMRTALLIDKSGSMHSAIEIGKELGAAIAQSCVANNAPITYLFDNNAIPIVWNPTDGDVTKKSSWDQKLKMFSANGGTNTAAPIRAMISKNEIVDQIVVVTDEGENHRGAFAKELIKYKEALGITPNVVIVRIGSSANYMESSLKENYFNVDVMKCEKIDQVAIPNLVNILSGKGVFELVQDILTLELPSRAMYDDMKKRTRKSRQDMQDGKGIGSSEIR